MRCSSCKEDISKTQVEAVDKLYAFAVVESNSSKAVMPYSYSTLCQQVSIKIMLLREQSI